MSRLIDISFGFPTIIFTTLLLFSLGYWAIALIFGFADFEVEAELDFESDMSGDVGGADGATDAGTSPINGLLRGLGIHYMPLPLAISVASLAGWALSLAGVWIFSATGSAGVLLGLVLLLLSFAFGLVVAGRIGRILRPVFEVTPAVRYRDLIGRLCTVRTGRVDDAFGQAEVVDAEKSTHLVQVRCRIDNQLTAGQQALIVDVEDDGLFVVSPDVEAIT